MKILLVMLSLIVVPSKQPRSNNLFGTWKLVKVETDSGIITPTMDFFLTISEDRLGFDRDVNDCTAKPLITESTIEFDSELCTRVCCDGERDPIGGMNLYRGEYNVTENSLTIQNENVRTYLKKIK